jgi:hypothetical protein
MRTGVVGLGVVRLRSGPPGVGSLTPHSHSVDLPVSLVAQHRRMALKRLKKLVATSALAVALSGGASAAVAQGETKTTTTDVPSAQQRPAVTARAKTAAHRQRLTEASWMAEQLRAERASRR